MAMMNLPKSEGSPEEIPQKPPTFLNTVKAVVFKNLFPISLVFFVALGILAPEPGVFFSKLPTHYVCVIGIFLHSGLKLKTGEVTDAFKAFKALIWGVICILLITPIVGGHLTGLLPFTVTKSHATKDCSDINGSNSWNGTSLSPEENPEGSSILGPFFFQIGMQIYFIVPCTISSGVILGCGYNKELLWAWRTCSTL
ncbi:hypothetical protein pdam_00004855 [Pocillopora damicornis]|uniref:Uncharacterized protein n=1 Tax=Pocillopora damicornis TaxID=46731 RepID=A0A3M6U940_POCDA|nr:hypothetical protein pdam_00004855 [Pocillopora damicornis]